MESMQKVGDIRRILLSNMITTIAREKDVDALRSALLAFCTVATSLGIAWPALLQDAMHVFPTRTTLWATGIMETKRITGGR